MVSSRQQVARIRRLAVRALDSYHLADPELPFIAHGENTTFRVDATACGVARRRPPTAAIRIADANRHHRWHVTVM